ncbi:MAG: DoxX family protein [Bacteroidetes bacterium]|nr:DoxX family protein [Bacteroidota bacterium]
MKRDKILYWATTGFVSLGFLMSSMMYLTHNPELMKGFSMLGYPVYFVNILGIAKLTGALALLNPWSAKLREWAYAGFTFTLIGAAWTHIATHTPPTAPIVFLVLLGASYFFHQKVYGYKMELMVR